MLVIIAAPHRVNGDRKEVSLYTFYGAGAASYPNRLPFAVRQIKGFDNPFQMKDYQYDELKEVADNMAIHFRAVMTKA